MPLGVGSSIEVKSPRLTYQAKKDLRGIARAYRKEVSGFYKTGNPVKKAVKLVPQRLISMGAEIGTAASMFLSSPLNYITGSTGVALSTFLEGASNLDAEKKAKGLLEKVPSFNVKEKEYLAQKVLIKEKGFISGFFNKKTIANVMKAAR